MGGTFDMALIARTYLACFVMCSGGCPIIFVILGRLGDGDGDLAVTGSGGGDGVMRCAKV